MKELIAATLELLERSGIAYCLLHGGNELQKAPASDLDLALAAKDLRRVEELLFSRQKPFCLQLLQYTSTGFYFVLADAGGLASRFLRLDVATDYRRNGRILMSSTELLAGRRRIDNIWVSAPSVEFSYLLANKVLKGDVPSGQRQRLQFVAGQLGPKADAVAARFFGRKLAPQVLSWLRRGDWDEMERCLPALKGSLLRRSFSWNPAKWLSYWVPELRRSWRRWLHPSGLSVAVLGPDGTAKKALIRRLPDVLAQAFRRCDLLHLRPGSSQIWDYLLGYMLRVRPWLARSSLVLLDGYYDDLLAGPSRFPPGGSLLRWGLRLIPKPDLFLVLDAPQRLAYRDLARTMADVVLLDSQSSEAALASEAIGAVLSFLRRRYARRRHLWFHPAGAVPWDGIGEPG
jgi:hypothetical protein